MLLHRVHHIAIICSNYERSKNFYTNILGLVVIKESYRENRQSYKLDLALNDVYCIELFSFPQPPARPSQPEAAGLRHLAFEMDDLDVVIQELEEKKLLLNRYVLMNTRASGSRSLLIPMVCRLSSMKNEAGKRMASLENEKTLICRIYFYYEYTSSYQRRFNWIWNGRQSFSRSFYQRRAGFTAGGYQGNEGA